LRTPCPACGGRGEAWAEASGPGGRVIEISRCAACDGFGEEVGVPCGACEGAGRRPATVPVAVRVPAGADAATRLRLDEQGDAGRGDGRRGDLVVRLEVTPDGAP
jgi:molecular chaperone DnaJ